MEKLSDILWDIPNNKWINHEFELQSDESEMVGQEILIHSQNIIGYLKFGMRHLGFQHN